MSYNWSNRRPQFLVTSNFLSRATSLKPSATTRKGASDLDRTGFLDFIYEYVPIIIFLDMDGTFGISIQGANFWRSIVLLITFSFLLCIRNSSWNPVVDKKLCRKSLTNRIRLWLLNALWPQERFQDHDLILWVCMHLCMPSCFLFIPEALLQINIILMVCPFLWTDSKINPWTTTAT